MQLEGRGCLRMMFETLVMGVVLIATILALVTLGTVSPEMQTEEKGKLATPPVTGEAPARPLPQEGNGTYAPIEVPDTPESLDTLRPILTRALEASR